MNKILFRENVPAFESGVLNTNYFISVNFFVERNDPASKR